MQFERKGTYTLEAVHNLIPTAGSGSLTVIDGVPVSMGSARYKLFAESNVCVGCGLKGEYYILERSVPVNTDKFHFNMYGVKDGKEILFTKDHVIPKSRGGTNKFVNFQTMCAPCNNAKGNRLSLEEGLEIVKLKQEIVILQAALATRNKEIQILKLSKDKKCPLWLPLLKAVLRVFNLHVVPLQKKNGAIYN
jgi:hypothetical protein